ncbi:MAG: DedA family protein [Chthoniobacterales bacterium]|nr:DedA family protein [Chthoniobacterales bacterium]
MAEIIDFFLHAERHLEWFITNYGLWIYVLLFLIIFCETGLIVTPFLPGDSLLFAVGALAAKGWMDVRIITPLLLIAAILGDAVNYSIGKWMGPKVFHYESSRFFNKEHLMKAHAFYEKYGGRAIILARFVPIVRTFAPFVAGVASMTYSKFAFFNITGAFLWVGLFLGGGYFFGGLEIVQKNMKLVILGIIIVSVLPIAWEFGKAWLTKRRSAQA